MYALGTGMLVSRPKEVVGDGAGVGAHVLRFARRTLTVVPLRSGREPTLAGHVQILGAALPAVLGRSVTNCSRFSVPA